MMRSMSVMASRICCCFMHLLKIGGGFGWRIITPHANGLKGCAAWYSLGNFPVFPLVSVNLLDEI